MAEGERVEFDEVVKPGTPATEGTVQKSTDEQAPTKEEVVKPSEATIYRAPNQL